MAVKRFGFVIAALLSSGAFAAGFSASATAAAADNTIRYGIDNPENIDRLPQEIAQREGFFVHEGLTVELVPFKSAFARTRDTAPAPAGNRLTIREGMAQGTINMSRQQLALLINDVMAGGKSVGVAITASNPIYFIAVRPEIRSFADLKGKTLTITNPRDGITLWSRKLLAQHGLGSADVSLKAIAGSPGRVDCLRSGECAAATLDQPAIFEALDAGFHSLGVTNEIGSQLNQLDVVNPAWATGHRDLVAKYIRATTAAMRFINDAKNRDEVLKVTMDFMKQPESHARQMLANIWDPKNRVFQTAAPDMNNVRAAIALMGEYDALKQPLPMPEQFVDLSYARAAGL